VVNVALRNMFYVFKTPFEGNDRLMNWVFQFNIILQEETIPLASNYFSVELPCGSNLADSQETILSYCSAMAQ
jgi:DNA-binding SARP family transcriptional activator